jgi:hypothetical protein
VPVYWEDMLDPAKKTFKPVNELRALYKQHGLGTSDEVLPTIRKVFAGAK